MLEQVSMLKTAWAFIKRILRIALRPIVLEIIQKDFRIWGDPNRVTIAASARMVNTLFNVSSGSITIGDNTFTGHNVSLLTGRHDYMSLENERMVNIPKQGFDITVGRGVWIGSNATILGPCTIGDHAVIAAGSVVTRDVSPYTVVAGVPAKVVKIITATKLQPSRDVHGRSEA